MSSFIFEVTFCLGHGRAFSILKGTCRRGAVSSIIEHSFEWRVMLATEIRPISAETPPHYTPFATVEAACGFPSPSQDYQTAEIDLNVHLMPNRVSTFIIRARGHSMTRAGIFDGDELIVDRSVRPQDGHVVVAVVDGEMTVKRLRIQTDNSVVLSAENSNYPDIVIPELSELHVWGVVIRSLHHVSRE